MTEYEAKYPAQGANAGNISSSELTVVSTLERAALLSELNRYVDELAEKRDSTGEKLLRIPSNFDSIVDSMNREDLHSGAKDDEKPWSQYLLFDSLNREEDGVEFEGRYKNLHLPDDSAMKISKGLAKIKMLDRQLHEVGRRAISANSESRNQSFESSGDLQSSDDVLRLHDGTFITKSKGMDFDNDTINQPHLPQQKSPKSPGCGKDCIGKINAPKSKHRELSEEEKLRLEILLKENEEDDEYLQFKKAIEEENKEIDSKLSEFGRLNRLKTGNDCGQFRLRMALAAGAEQDLNDLSAPVTDYLALQREEREERQYAMKLEAMLQRSRSQSLDYRALVESNPQEIGSPASSSSNRPGRFSSQGSPRSARSIRSQRSARSQDSTSSTRSHDVPDVSLVRPDAAVTFEDIQTVLDSIVAEYVDGCDRSNLDASIVSKIPLESRQRIEDMLNANFKDNIAALQRARERHRLFSASSRNRSFASNILANGEEGNHRLIGGIALNDTTVDHNGEFEQRLEITSKEIASSNCGDPELFNPVWEQVSLSNWREELPPPTEINFDHAAIRNLSVPTANSMIANCEGDQLPPIPKKPSSAQNTSHLVARNCNNIDIPKRSPPEEHDECFEGEYSSRPGSRSSVVDVGETVFRIGTPPSSSNRAATSNDETHTLYESGYGDRTGSADLTSQRRAIKAKNVLDNMSLSLAGTIASDAKKVSI